MEIDRERIRGLALEILEATKEDNGLATQPVAGEEDVLLTVAEVAKRLQVNENWVVKRAGEFPGSFRLGNGQRAGYRFPRRGVLEWEKKNAIAS